MKREQSEKQKQNYGKKMLCSMIMEADKISHIKIDHHFDQYESKHSAPGRIFRGMTLHIDLLPKTRRKPGRPKSKRVVAMKLSPELDEYDWWE
jgi:hypothetical protein